MKRIVFKAVWIFMFAAVICCNGNKNTPNGKKFQPKERVSSLLTEGEREAAIAEKRAALDSMQLDMETLVFNNNIKLTVLPPVAKGDISDVTSSIAATKMMQIVAQNGVGGYGNSPAFCLASVFTPTGRMATGTVPQRMLTKYTITFVVGNMLTSDIYATYDMDVEGVGSSFEEAAYNAVNSIKNEKGIQQMLKTATERILAWYNDDPQRFKSTVESFVAKQDYATAYALLATVPKQAPICFKYAQSRQTQVLEEMKTQKAEELLTELRNRIASAGDQYDPMVSGSLQMIPARSKQYAEGKRLYDNYVKHVRDVRLENMRHEQKMELEQLALERMKLKYEQEASMKAAKKAFTPPSGESLPKESAGSSGGGIMSSFQEHPFLWGLGIGAVAIATGGIGLYSSLPLMTKVGLALL